jgi:N-acetylglucosaminyldiphosphoundecaprenol N-acetyl-beta-D-mannosaminyltransferase
MSRTVTLLSVPVSLMRIEEAAAAIDRFLSENRLHRIVTVNPEFLVSAYGNPDFRKLLASADLATADGTGIIFAARLSGTAAAFSERITGVALTELLLERAAKQNLPVLIVLRHNSLTAPELLRQKLRLRYPQLSVTVLREPITAEAARDAVLVFAALGSPSQEFWIAEHAGMFPAARVAIGVGGTFDFISGTMHRAPAQLRHLGLEWLWRLILEPKRIRRIFRAVIVFPYLLLRHRS